METKTTASRIALTQHEYQQALRDGKLLGLRCSNCDRIMVNTRLTCPDCGNGDLKVTELETTGELYTYTIIHVLPERFGDQESITVAIVDLDGGGRVMGRLVGEPAETIAVGMRVAAVEPIEVDGVVVPGFRPVSIG